MSRYSNIKRSPKKRKTNSPAFQRTSTPKRFSPRTPTRSSSNTSTPDIWFTPSTSPSPKNVKHLRVQNFNPDLGEYEMWVPGGAVQVHDRWTPGENRIRLIDYQKSPGDYFNFTSAN